jgi:hypothetical protein
MRATYDGLNGTIVAGPPGRIGLLSVYFINGSVIPGSLRCLNTVGCHRGRCGLGPFRHERGLPDSHTVFHALSHGTGAAKNSIISPRQPTPTIKSNVVDRTQDYRLHNSTDKSCTSPCTHIGQPIEAWVIIYITKSLGRNPLVHMHTQIYFKAI